MAKIKATPSQDTLLYRLSTARNADGEPMFDAVEARKLIEFHDLAHNALKLLKKEQCWCDKPEGEHTPACKTALYAWACLDDED